MSHVNRNDRLSRRLLGFLGRLDAVEAMVKGGPKVVAVEAEVKALTEKVAALEKALAEVNEARSRQSDRISGALEAIDAIEARLAPVAPATTDAVPA